MSSVDEVKARLDIVDVVGGYVRLQKAGRYFKAPCPFHEERTPSFIVSPDRQTWHCFGACGTGGDVISFVARKENLDFGGALRLLAERAGVELQSDGARRQQAKGLQDANEAAALFFHALLPNARDALAYAEERGLDRKTIADFQIGYAPAGWEGLRDHLARRGFSPELLVEAGLLIEGERGPYDRFRDRLMFPIRDDRGRVVGFGGRVLPGRPESGPKYMNTPQTPVFDKGAILYGLDRARETIRRAGVSVIVEGYMDVVAAHQHGFTNVVAAMGTSLTDRQATLLRRFAERIVLAMDADEAGSAANLRAVQVVAAAQAATRSRNSGPLDLRVLALPSGKDPDELVRSDPAAWSGAVEAARPVVDHLIAVVSGGLDLSQPQDRSTMVSEVLPAISQIVDPVLQAHYLQRLSRLARVSEDALRRDVSRARRAGRAQRESASGDNGQALPARQRPLSAPREEFLLALLHRFPELQARGHDLPEDLLSLSENRELLRRWRENQPILEEESELFEHYQKVLATRIPVSDTAEVEVAFSDCVERLRHVRMRSVKEASVLALAEGEAGVRPGQVASIARARLEAGDSEEVPQDVRLQAVASALLDDMEAGLRFHARSLASSRPDEAQRRLTDS